MPKQNPATGDMPEGVQIDREGFPHNGDCRLTRCCFAAATFDTDSGELYCKGCYNVVDLQYGDLIAK